MKLIPTTVGLCLTASVLAACGGGGSGSKDGDAKIVDGGTFSMALNADPGNLDPHSGVSSALFSISQLSYDHLFNTNFDDGSIESGLASKWDVKGNTVTATLTDGVTCSDGTKLTASDVVANLDYIADPKNESPLLGAFLPVGATSKADDAAGTVTVTLAAPAPFVLQGLANIPIVCPAGMKDRAALAKTSSGTGPYELTEAAPGNQYTYKIRDGYTWGPDGATTATKGMPDTIIMKIVENESTAANLLLSGGLNGAIVSGSDSKRLEKSKLTTYDTANLSGEQWYNQTKGRPTVDPKVRLALTQALDLAELQKVLTAGNGKPATTFAALDPVACPGDSVSDALPKQDVDAAKAVLAAANLPELTFVYNPSSGGGVSAAAELAVQQWKAAGVTVKAKAQNVTAIQETVFGTGNWDIAWLPVNVSSPDQLVPFLSGPATPEGTNFANIANDDYEAGVKKASTMNGQEGCATWLDAESALVEAADVIPFANSIGKTYRAKATFDYPGQMVPTSIRMLAN
ncbi:ABC transporter substrate-binding protein [Aeromicrobium chenweiae]|uniref:Peptide ABC transporter substrate-binding protein n=1 Tax=Aeromicrobium chenweiae TaxID=2079793 RepID=A0A2S0WJU2_9ACTN|nr:ABC transporter substrate-binding protein [Aeromicrobium chenweiae]AWB91510.1 peptide ABC transporter substrate-binding protein [Aeromicrobium chenweiae]TGN32345.1 ABC transporter substrate-binding protein [Aeromicrobium chenweiae]